MKIVVVLFLCLNISLIAQCKCNRYTAGIEYVKQDFINKGIEKYYKEILDPEAYGISIYKNFFPLYKSDSYLNWLNIEKTKPSKKSRCLSKLNRIYWNKQWRSEDYYKNQNVFTKEEFKGPSHIAIFTKLKKDSLRIDVISNSFEGLKYCGSVYKYLLIFDKYNNIKESKTWTDHYECL